LLVGSQKYFFASGRRDPSYVTVDIDYWY